MATLPGYELYRRWLIEDWSSIIHPDGFLVLAIFRLSPRAGWDKKDPDY